MMDEENQESLLGGQEGGSSSAADVASNPFVLDDGGAEAFASPVPVPTQPPPPDPFELPKPNLRLDDFYESAPQASKPPPSAAVQGGVAAAQAQAPPAWSKGQAAVEAEKRLEEIAERERELAQREERLREKEREADRLAAAAGGAQSDDKTKKNWPWFFPLVHNDIPNDIPVEHQGLVRYGFICWILTECGYCLNFFIMFLLLLTGNSLFSTFLITCMATAGGISLSWICWYQALYKLAQTDSAIFANLKFFFHFCFHLLFCGLAFLSPPIIGTFNAGLFTMIYEFEKGGGIHKFFGVLCLVNTLIWLATGLLSLWILQWTFRNFRSGGGVEATQQAAASGLIAAKASMNTFGSMATSAAAAAKPPTPTAGP
uniref:Secretory carrier-associated membrane protein n=1 Tax=Chloropicon laureae TaxID=464258 RepID=A0A7S2Z1H0_9CHLO|mmetsp:Transcript_1561/g.4005  ORF Transcript_1561/g.4005 Transcript_1561/m.4005 type:complete len:373 (+) Transcript_1561:222-1340(+)|eukprot:CAMPEP_0197500028 /NCGR_PEP_ID=MMETSP1311-20131121/61319_1 /TAXON_ID=464262 /ORGANISM="Genus nov. species nov., Strain RCC856" /LENGTH=372 /DNA_ID=CAMNT_0043045779 /DNA_START=220 /DNA_END=1338 /DNA_ORIENTATION=-